MKIAFCSSEATPFAKTGGLADVCGALPLALEKLKANVVLFIPGFKCVDGKKFGIKKLNNFVSTTTIGKNVEVYFIESEKYFHRSGLYGNSRGDYPDNLERFQFFCTKTLEVFKQLNIKPDIVHCHDWQTALIPAYLKHVLRKDPFYEGMKTVLTIHNLAFQGTFAKEQYPQLGLSKKLFTHEGFEFYEKVNLLKGGITYSDEVTTVSPCYAKEIQTEELGSGLDGVIRAKDGRVDGILNGIDYELWNPNTDKLLEYQYSSKSLEGKAKSKRELQKELKLSAKKNTPIFGFVGRLSHQKGIDLIIGKGTLLKFRKSGSILVNINGLTHSLTKSFS